MSTSNTMSSLSHAVTEWVMPQTLCSQTLVDDQITCEGRSDQGKVEMPSKVFLLSLLLRTQEGR